MTALAQDLAASPEPFPHDVNVENGTVSLVRLTEPDYRAASFLDARILGLRMPVRTVAWQEVADAAAGLPQTCDFIFHIGHVGSTLLSRLMGAHPGVFALREPLALRTLAQRKIDGRGDVDAYLPTLLALWSRTFRPRQRAVVKATSFASELAADILARPWAPRAIFMAVSAETYLATILGGPNSRQEARMLGASRFARLQRRLGRSLPPPATEGELIAMSWACEMSALRAAGAGDHALWLDFDRFLDAPETWLAKCLRHIGVTPDDAEIAAILTGPDMRTYSKAQQHGYDAQLRRDVLNQARALSGAEIRRGLNWLEKNGPG
ncbi:MAG TPA: hypothetical protein VMH86_17370 [Rhizomicrobium sp.]|nr:hypothetical protein [Rhizomicrobium sp.]